MSQINVDKVKQIMTPGQIFNIARTSNIVTLDNYQTVKIAIPTDFEESAEATVRIYAVLNEAMESEDDVVEIATHTIEIGEESIPTIDITADKLAEYETNMFIVKTDAISGGSGHYCSMIGIFSNPRYGYDDLEFDPLVIQDE